MSSNHGYCYGGRRRATTTTRTFSLVLEKGENGCQLKNRETKK